MEGSDDKSTTCKKKKKKDTRSFLSLAVGHTFPVISLDSVNAWREVTFPTFGIAAGQELVKLDLFTNCSNCLSALFYRRTGISMSHTVTKKKYTKNSMLSLRGIYIMDYKDNVMVLKVIEQFVTATKKVKRYIYISFPLRKKI